MSNNRLLFSSLCCAALLAIVAVAHHANRFASTDALAASIPSGSTPQEVEQGMLNDSPAAQIQSTQLTPQPKGMDKPLPCPLGLAWGESMATVKKVLYDKGYTPDIQDDPVNRIDAEVAFTGKNASMYGEKIDHVDVFVGEKGLHGFGIAYTRPPGDQDTLAQYHRIAKELAAAYDKPNLTVFAIEPAFSRSPKMEMLDISRGIGIVYDSWNFHPSNRKANEGTVGVYLSAKPTTGPSVSVSYFNQTLLRPG